MATILTVDDSPSVRQMVKLVLGSSGHSVTEACDGADGLAKAAAQKFDLVLTDLQMPEMDGFQLTAAIRERERQNPAVPRLPIIALTAHAMIDDRARCLAAGMDGYLSKPILAEELAREIDRGLGNFNPPELAA